MALTPRLSNLGANAAADAVCALANNAFLRIYDGTQPTDADTALGAQVLLAELRLNATAFGAAAAGTATANALTAPNAVASGTPTWFRVLKSDGTSALWDGSVGTATTNLVLSAATITAGLTVTVTAMTYQQAKV